MNEVDKAQLKERVILKSEKDDESRDNKVLSVIIPAYNVEAYIDRLLPSLLIPEIKDELEILFIDDGSTDGTCLKARAYADRYENLQVYSKANAGHGSVINHGILHASGEYFKVVDGDDYVEKQGLINLVHYLKHGKTDIVINPYYICDQKSGRKRLKYNRQIAKVKRKTGKWVCDLDEIYEILQRIYMHAMTVRTELLREHGVRVTESCYYDDFQYTLYPLPYVQTVTCLSDPVYVYMVGQAGQSVQAKSAYRNLPMFKKILKDSVAWSERLSGLSQEKQKIIEIYMISLLNNISNVYIRNADERTSYPGFVAFLQRAKEQYPLFFAAMEKEYRHIRFAAVSPAAFYLTSRAFFVYEKFMH